MLKVVYRSIGGGVYNADYDRELQKAFNRDDFKVGRRRDQSGINVLVNSQKDTTNTSGPVFTKNGKLRW